MHIEVSEKEYGLFIGLVEREISDLGPEIRRTRTPTYHDELKARKAMLLALAERLKAIATT